MGSRFLYLVDLNIGLEIEAGDAWPLGIWRRQRGPWVREAVTDAGLLEALTALKSWLRPTMRGRRSSQVVRRREGELRTAAGTTVRVVPAPELAALLTAGAHSPVAEALARVLQVPAAADGLRRLLSESEGA